MSFSISDVNIFNMPKNYSSYSFKTAHLRRRGQGVQTACFPNPIPVILVPTPFHWLHLFTLSDLQNIMQLLHNLFPVCPATHHLAIPTSHALVSWPLIHLLPSVLLDSCPLSPSTCKGPSLKLLPLFDLKQLPREK